MVCKFKYILCKNALFLFAVQLQQSVKECPHLWRACCCSLIQVSVRWDENSSDNDNCLLSREKRRQIFDWNVLKVRQTVTLHNQTVCCTSPHAIRGPHLSIGNLKEEPGFRGNEDAAVRSKVISNELKIQIVLFYWWWIWRWWRIGSERMACGGLFFSLSIRLDLQLHSCVASWPRELPTASLTALLDCLGCCGYYENHLETVTIWQ